MRRLPIRVAGILTAAALALSACSANTGDEGGAGEGGDTIRVVASTNVYGNILESVGGEFVSVESIINRPSQDPHSYEATARDKLAVSEAAVVVLNGGGYDSFMETLVQEESVASENVLNAVEISGLEEDGHEGEDHGSEESGDDHAGHSHGAFNEHVWYDPDAMGLLAEAAAERLAELDPENEQAFRDNAAAFNSGIQELEDRLAEVRTVAAGRDVAMTEPVPAYLLEDAGLHNVTPDDFTEAVEEGQDVPPAVLKQMQDLMASGKIAFLAYNEQTSTSQTEAVRSTAEDAGIPVVDFSETLPEGEDFLAWMDRNVTAIQDVLK
ncbi:metal ABC transporter solute-binding protein, Zn/Mn family [Arthrobacter koreensis]|uniref:metal ABC transporter solute-binding protein, Zn/Mn family n=1 Tax=Arthrobacter koreensis TaxID=199136 RepID=UPI002DB6BF2C|nr:zinc ABC transporter substrate-binding protein [Arthrobacter koreensis]MEB7504515.1 zinc ABC transporter substrate-binding protein [Arthrobacter koreensis]